MRPGGQSFLQAQGVRRSVHAVQRGPIQGRAQGADDPALITERANELSEQMADRGFAVGSRYRGHMQAPAGLTNIARRDFADALAQRGHGDRRQNWRCLGWCCPGGCCLRKPRGLARFIFDNRHRGAGVAGLRQIAAGIVVCSAQGDKGIAGLQFAAVEAQAAHLQVRHRVDHTAQQIAQSARARGAHSAFSAAANSRVPSATAGSSGGTPSRRSVSPATRANTGAAAVLPP